MDSRVSEASIAQFEASLSRLAEFGDLAARLAVTRYPHYRVEGVLALPSTLEEFEKAVLAVRDGLGK